jgi:hypothetical protein
MLARARNLAWLCLATWAIAERKENISGIFLFYSEVSEKEDYHPPQKRGQSNSKQTIVKCIIL